MNKEKIKELVLYLVFGVLTTVVNLIVYALCNKVMDVLISNVVAWIAAVAFAYVTNKLFVFESKSWAKNIVVKEVISFAGARLLTLGIEEAGLLIMLKWLKWAAPLQSFAARCLDLTQKVSITMPEKLYELCSGENVVKIILAVVVVILNYIFSKLIIFKNKDNS